MYYDIFTVSLEVGMELEQGWLLHSLPVGCLQVVLEGSLYKYNHQSLYTQMNFVGEIVREV